MCYTCNFNRFSGTYFKVEMFCIYSYMYKIYMAMIVFPEATNITNIVELLAYIYLGNNIHFLDCAKDFRQSNHTVHFRTNAERD